MKFYHVLPPAVASGLAVFLNSSAVFAGDGGKELPVVPEPASLLIWGAALGLGAVCWLLGRKRRK